jgi:hypothetical protein
MPKSKPHSNRSLRLVSTDEAVLDPQALWMAEARDTAIAQGWAKALMGVAWVHLAFFAVAQGLTWSFPLLRWPYPFLWMAEVVAILVLYRKVCGVGWIRANATTQLVARIWGTCLVLAFSLVTLNMRMGAEVIWWFKPAWCTLASFGFAIMSWLFSLWFLVPAFQMYFTAHLIVTFPEEGYLIHGLSWWLALHLIALALVRSRAADASDEVVPDSPSEPLVRSAP